MKYRLLGFIASAAALSAAPLMAHHGDAGRYQDEVTTVTGTVVVLQLVNPHSSIIFEVEDDEGNVVRWQAEVGSPRQLAANFGWDRNTCRRSGRIDHNVMMAGIVRALASDPGGRNAHAR